jgi:demethylmenaquinone methyltransferase/2-methoxy-6-polyprenyl-1,4-benzoquinol methylase
VRAIFDRSAVDYDRIERLMALGSGSWYRRQALLRAGLAPGMRVVDVGVGTGLVACEAVRVVGAGSLVIGVDPSPGMLSARCPRVKLCEGQAERCRAGRLRRFRRHGYALRHGDPRRRSANSGDISRGHNLCAVTRRTAHTPCFSKATCAA